MKKEETGSSARSDDLRRALVAIRNLRNKVAGLEQRQREPIAIIGQSCRLPGGADSPEKLWEMLRSGVDATCDVPKDRWDADAIYDPDPESAGGSYVRRGGFLQEPVDRFDPAFFSISPREASAMDPMHRILLELAWEALENAGIPPLSLDGSLTGVFTGLSVSDYDVVQQGNSLDSIHSYRGTGTISSIACGRISHFLGLQGPNFPVDTACSSGLVALVLATEQLRSGACDLALAGAVNLMLSPKATILLCRMRALAADGRCRTFDAAASGYSRGEGGGMFVLKRLSDAEKANDRILAVIRGVACNHDGHSSGLTVPNPAAQRKVIEAALRDGGVNPLEIDYVEAHGTATELGDPIELRALTSVLCNDRKSETPLRLGAVKTNVGHLEAAAGITGVLKVIQSLRNRQIPPHLHFESPTPHIDWANMPLEVPTELTEWTSAKGPRLAGVSAFGFSGTNAHIIVEEAPEKSGNDEKPIRPHQLIAISANDQNAVRELAGRYCEQVESAGDIGIADLATTSTVGRSHLNYRAVATGANALELGESLRSLHGANDSSLPRAGLPADLQIAFLFTGQGAQSPGMAKVLWDSSPLFRQKLELCDQILGNHVDRDFLPLLLDEQAAGDLAQTKYTQPALFAFEYALYELWRSWGVEPVYVMGHSLGEYVAATVAGIIDLEDALPLVALRGRLMQDLPSEGKMLAVFAAEPSVRSFMADLTDLSIAAFNGPENIVVSGPSGSIMEFSARLARNDIAMSELQVSHAFHSSLMDPMLDEFERAVRKITLHSPQISLISNSSGKPITKTEAVDPARWRRHVREPVLFASGISALVEAGINCFVEIGPHPTLSGLGMESSRSGNIQWLPSLRRGWTPWKQLSESIGKLYCAGYDIDWNGWESEHSGSVVVGPKYPFQRERYWYTDEAAIPNNPEPSSAAIAIGPAAVHPLLGSAIQSPALAGWVFHSSLLADRPTYLRSHSILGKIVVPGAQYIEMMRAAGREGPKWDAVRIADLEFERPLVIDQKNAVACQVIVEPVDEQTANVKIVSKRHTDSDWVTHARAVILRDSDSIPSSTESLEDRRAFASTAFDVANLYASIERRGIQYGSSFQTLLKCWTGPEAAIGLVQLADCDANEVESYGVHPCVLDAGFQLLASIAASDADEDSTRLPASIDGIRFLKAMKGKGWVHGVEKPQADAGVFVADITYFDEDGDPCVEVLGYKARRVDGSMLRDALDAYDSTSRIYQIDWQVVDLPETAENQEPTGVWLVLDDDGAAGNLVSAYIEARGGRCIRVRRGGTWQQQGDDFTVSTLDDGAWTRLFGVAGIGVGKEPLQGFVHLWALDQNVNEGSTASEISAGIQENILPIVRMLHDDVLGPEARVLVVTQGASGPEGSAPGAWSAGSALWGLFPVIQAEHPEFECRILDLEAGQMPGAEQPLMQILLGQCAEDRLAIHDGQLFSPRLAWRSDASEHSDYRPVPHGDGYRIDIEKRGTIDALRYLPADRREPDADEIEIRIRATGLNFRDVLNVLGMYPGDPGPPGVEVAGVVTRTGRNVDHVVVGDSVFGLGNGAFSGYITTPAAGVVRIPAGTTVEEAATIPLAFLTAEWGLTHIANLAAGERVLIHAAAGGVGQAAVQLAQSLGAEVHATAGSDEKREFLRMQGLEHVYSSREASFADRVLEATNGEGVDVVLNALTGEMLQRSVDLLRDGGRFIELGKAELLDSDDLSARKTPIIYSAFDLGSVLVETPEIFQQLFNGVVDRFESGELRPLRVQTYCAEQVVEAFRYMAQARHIGKVVVTSRRHSSQESTPKIREDSSYIVTGATGGVGQKLVKWLVEKGAGAIILNSRADPAGTDDDWLRELSESDTSIKWVGGDIAESDCAAALVTEAMADGRSLAGVFHAAGWIDDSRLVDTTRDQIRSVLAAKVEGAWHLHRATQTLDLDLFVLFSSVAAIMGGPGQAIYAAANATLGALAERRRRCGLPAVTLEWGAWNGLGMAGRLDERERQVLENQGMGFLSPENAMQSLGELIPDTVAARRIIAEFDWSRIPSGISSAPPLLRTISTGSRDMTAGSPQKNESFDMNEYRSLGADGRLRSMTGFLQKLLQVVMGARPDQLDGDVRLSDMGFDSLMAMELRNHIETAAGIIVPVSKLLASVTVADLALELYEMLDAGRADDAPSQEKESWDEGEI